MIMTSPAQTRETPPTPAQVTATASIGIATTIETIAIPVVSGRRAGERSFSFASIRWANRSASSSS